MSVWDQPILHLSDILSSGKSAERQRVACAISDGPGDWPDVIGVNRRILFPTAGKQENGQKFTLHAEEDALRRFHAVFKAGHVDPSHVFVLRLTPGGRVALARPCDSCMRMLLRAGAREIYWTTNTGTVDGGKTGL